MKIGIIGLGLIGGSLLKCLSGENLEIIAITRNPQTVSGAKKYTPYVSNYTNDLYNCDVVFVCTPINRTLETLDILENIVSPECIVTDVASVKEFVMEKSRPYKFIGSHPMAGTENSGYDASFKELFEGAKWALTPSENTTREDINKLINIIKLTYAKPIITNAKDHDMAVALISHMPLLLSQALFMSAYDNELAQKLAASGFRDMTRLAMSNTTMASDMLEYNRQNIMNSLNILEENIKILDSPEYFDLITKIKSNRQDMYSKDGKNIL